MLQRFCKTLYDYTVLQTAVYYLWLLYCCCLLCILSVLCKLVGTVKEVPGCNKHPIVFNLISIPQQLQQYTVFFKLVVQAGLREIGVSYCVHNVTAAVLQSI